MFHAGKLLVLPVLASLIFTVIPSGRSAAAAEHPSRKPRMDDTIRATVYADNWFSLYVNGELVAVDSIAFLPHNVIAVDLLPAYPMTIAVMARDNADPTTGMEYANSQIGDGGFILKFSDGTVTDRSWKVRVLDHGPIRGDTVNPRVRSTPPPKNWWAVDFDDHDWQQATEYPAETVRPKAPFFDHDFAGAQFIWSADILLDNVVLFRKQVLLPPDGRSRPDFTGLNDRIPQQPNGRRDQSIRRGRSAG